MADDWFDIDNIKITLKKAAKRPMPFAFGVGAKLGEGQIAMHPKRKPEFLGRALKKEGFKASRILVGTAQTEGSKLLVTCEAEVPKAKKSLKFFMKENGLRQKKVQLFGPNGEFDASDDDADEQEADVAAVAAPESPDEDQIMFKRRIAEFAPRIKKLMAEGGAEAKPLAVKFKQAHTVGQNGDYANALTLLDDLEKQIEATSKASPQTDDLTAEWSQRLKNIAPQIKEVLTAKPEGFRDIALKFKEAQGFGSKKDYEAGIAALDEVGAMIKSLNSNLDERKAEWAQRIKKLAPQIKEVLTAKPEGFRDIALKFKEAQGFEAKQDYDTGIAMLDEVGTMIANLTGEQQKQEAEWTKRYKALESDLETVLQQNLGDPSKLRAARDMAIEKAESGDHGTALKILDRLQPSVAQALASAKTSSEEDKKEPESKKGKIAPSVAFTQSRLAWNTARKKVMSELTSLEKAILEAAKDEDSEIFQEIKSKTSQLYDILGARDEKLMDKLDEGYNAEKNSPAQLKAYDEAGKLVDGYMKFVNGSPLVQEIDSNPFRSVDVRKTLDMTFKVLSDRLPA